jgi:putative glutamine amidotransferase
LDRIDGLLLSGGYDVCPGLFGEETLNDSVEIDGLRDEAEMPLIRAAVERDIPILAICRGVQILNVALGGTLIQDLPTQRDSRIRHRQEGERQMSSHAVCIIPNSRLREIVGSDEVDVNSFHHQSLQRVADGLSVVATAPDGVIEAVERSDSRFVVGVQWHPEEMTEVSDEAKRLFESFVKAAARD